jgi:signal transduction histidine kinase
VTRFPGGWPAADRRPPTWAAFTVGTLLTSTVLFPADLSPWRLAGLVVAALGALASLAWHPLIPLGAGAVLSQATALAMTTTVPPWTAALGAAVAVTSGLAGRRTVAAGPAMWLFAVAAVLAVPIAVTEGEAWATGLLMLLITVVVPWFVGRYGRQQAELVEATAERARLHERTRIAHEMHDSLGHELSLLALRSGALELAPDLPDRHRAAAGELRAGAGTATERLSEIVGVLRGDEPAPLTPVGEGIAELVERTAGSGMAVSLDWHGRPDLSPAVDKAAYRVVREALTNAGKHAPGAAVTVRVAVEADETVVTVTNGPPRGTPPRAAGGRIGLAGLRERVGLCGGTFRAGPRDGGFQVVARLPHERTS